MNASTTKNIPVIAIDGPSGSGKGTIAAKLAEKLGWHLLDSGALYRVLGYGVDKNQWWEEQPRWADLAANLPVSFELVDGRAQAFYQGENIEKQIRCEEGAAKASKVAVVPAVRDALLSCQRDFAKAPGLIADGRDMGTQVFPQAPLKIFLTASAEVRAQRRYLQLKETHESVSLAALLNDIEQRDARDMNRAVSPLVAAADAIQLDSSTLSIDEVLSIVLEHVQQRHLNA